MTAPNEERHRLADEYLRGRTLEEALATWRSDYDSPAYREHPPMLVRLGNVIRMQADEAAGVRLRQQGHALMPHSTASPS